MTGYVYISLKKYISFLIMLISEQFIGPINQIERPCEMC